jgi:DNA primase
MCQETEKFEKLVSICHANLKNSEEVSTYMQGRGIDDGVVQEYKLGFFPQNLEVLKGYIDEEFLFRNCIVKNSYHSDFKDFNKMIIPVFNEYGEPVGIVGRCTDSLDFKALGIPKYKNSSYKKNEILFGLNIAYDYILKSDRVFIVEGYLDQIAMYKNGIKNVVAMGGTAFSKKHMLKLLRLTNNIFFIYDRDEAGLATAKRIKDRFENEFININFLIGPEEYKDVDEFFRAKSKRDFFENFKLFSP